jgi:hypothetical protein
MLFGGWLYPDAPSTGFAAAGVTFDEDKDEDEADCPTIGTHVAPATSAPIPYLPFKRQQPVRVRSFSL